MNPGKGRNRATNFRWRTLVALCLCTGLGLGGQKRKNEEPKSQVQPLPPQPPMALKADTDAVDFHLSPLLKSGGLAAQIRTSLNELIRDTKGETIVKLRAFVAGAGDARRVQAEVTQIFTERKLPLPVLSVVQVGALGVEASKVVIEAVVSTHRSVNPNGLAFFAGHNTDSVTKAIDRLHGSMRAAGVAGDRMLLATCFVSRLENFSALRAELQTAFPHAEINLVQPLRDSPTDSALCEAVGQLEPAAAEEPVVLLKEDRVALVRGRQLVWTGLQLSFGSYLDDAHQAFARLERSSASVDPVEAAVQVNVFSLDPSGGSALRKTTGVPPSTFTAQTIEGLPSVDATAGIEAILAPGIQSPTLRP